ncbi:MAG: class I SAM-dependent methyltransferase [Parabacteroides sp.]|nr:class I SAM-dependent methyltransferase [Parabacteroides sp.]
MNSTQKANVQKFDEDAMKLGGYFYYTSDKLSVAYANKRIDKAIEQCYDFTGKKILELGCGDGTCSFLMRSLGAEYIVGIDPAKSAIKAANKKAFELGVSKSVSFFVGDIYTINLIENFDCVVFSRVLHHLPSPDKAIQRATAWADEILIIEPNGSNPVLKVIEKMSSYHKEHEETSFTASRIKKWLSQGNTVVSNVKYINLVPMFCPNWMAKICKLFTPIVEIIPLFRILACGQIIITAKVRNDTIGII